MLVTYLRFNSLWELAGLVTWLEKTGQLPEQEFQFPMGISGFGDWYKRFILGLWAMAFQFPMGISGFGDRNSS